MTTPTRHTDLQDSPGRKCGCLTPHRKSGKTAAAPRTDLLAKVWVDLGSVTCLSIAHGHPNLLNNLRPTGFPKTLLCQACFASGLGGTPLPVKH